MNSRPTAESKLERWRIDVGPESQARLDIPADAARERTFEISCSMFVRAAADAREPWHELRVYADGRLQWSRRIETAHPADFDGLDFRFRQRVAVGQAVRLLAVSECREARRTRLVIEADEV